MTSCVLADESGALYLSSSSVDECSTFILIDADEYHDLIAHTTITGADVSAYYSFGFALVFFGWIISFPIKAALKAIRLI